MEALKRAGLEVLSSARQAWTLDKKGGNFSDAKMARFHSIRHRMVWHDKEQSCTWIRKIHHGKYAKVYTDSDVLGAFVFDKTA